MCSKPGNDHTLFPIQARAFVEAVNADGLLAQIRVGGGKTLISFLLPSLMGAKRPLLLMPSSLIEEKHHEYMHDYRPRWKVHESVRIMSYEKLSQSGSDGLLYNYQPDLVICDEAHKLRNSTAARTRRFMRWANASVDSTKFVFMTGSLTRKGILDYWHLAKLALGQNSPVPLKYIPAKMWGDAIGAKSNQIYAPHPGAILQFCTEEIRTDPSLTDLEKARIGFRRRMNGTEGVLSSTGKLLDIDLIINEVDLSPDEQIADVRRTMRVMEETPDGDIIDCPLVMYQKIREVSHGFYSIWDPPPPKHWLEARKEWKMLVRDVLKQNKPGLDSPMDVANYWPDCPQLLRWKSVEKEYDPNKNRKPVWISEQVLDYAEEWLREHGGIVWTEHADFGIRMHERGWTYFGGGKQASIDIRTHEGPMVASIQAHGTGRNLQRYKRCLVLSPPSSGSTMEQLLGRLVRSGQTAKEIIFDMLLFLPELNEGLLTTIGDAKYIETTTGSLQLILNAKINRK